MTPDSAPGVPVDGGGEQALLHFQAFVKTFHHVLLLMLGTGAAAVAVGTGAAIRDINPETRTPLATTAMGVGFVLMLGFLILLLHFTVIGLRHARHVQAYWQSYTGELPRPQPTAQQ